MKILATFALAAATLVALPVSAQSFQKPEDAIKYRKSAFTVMAAHFGTLGAMANGRMPYDAQQAARSGDVVAIAATLPWAGFTAGTDKGDTRAKPEIWSEQAKFQEGQQRLVADMGRLAAAAKSGNLDTLKAAFSQNSGSCKACHDAYRKD